MEKDSVSEKATEFLVPTKPEQRSLQTKTRRNTQVEWS
jgi:hypothetical protein